MLHPPDINQESNFSAVYLGWIFKSTHPEINRKSCWIFNRAMETGQTFLTNKATSLTRKLSGQKSSAENVVPLVVINTRQVWHSNALRISPLLSL